MSLPHLVMPAPYCSRCGREVEWDDGWSCVRCDVFWDRHATDGDVATPECRCDPTGVNDFCPQHGRNR